MHIAKYSRRRGHEPEKPKEEPAIADEEISRIASEIAVRLPGSSSATAEEMTRIVHEALARFQSRFEESLAKLAEAKPAPEPAPEPPPQPPIGEEIARQNEMLVAKITGVLATQLAAALSAHPAPEPPRMAPEEIQRVADSVAQSAVTSIDEGIEKVRQAIAGLAAAVRSSVPPPVDTEAVAAKVHEKVQPLIASLARGDTSEVVARIAAVLAGMKESLKSAIPAPQDPEVMAGRVEEKVRALLAEAPRGEAGAIAREVAALQQSLLPMIREEIAGIVDKRGARTAKELRRDVWAVEQKVQQIIDEELERKLMWIVPGLVVDGVRMGVDESVRPEKFAAAAARVLREKLTRDLESGVKRIFGRGLDKRLSASVRRLIARALREVFPSSAKLRKWAAEGAKAGVGERLGKELGRALRRELKRPRGKARAKKQAKAHPERSDVALPGILKAVVEKKPPTPSGPRS